MPTDLVQKGFNSLQISGCDESLLMWNDIFDGIGELLLPTKAAPIASLVARSFDH